MRYDAQNQEYIRTNPGFGLGVKVNRLESYKDPNWKVYWAITINNMKKICNDLKRTLSRTLQIYLRCIEKNMVLSRFEKSRYLIKRMVLLERWVSYHLPKYHQERMSAFMVIFLISKTCDKRSSWWIKFSRRLKLKNFEYNMFF